MKQITMTLEEYEDDLSAKERRGRKEALRSVVKAFKQIKSGMNNNDAIELVFNDICDDQDIAKSICVVLGLDFEKYVKDAVNQE